LKNAKTEPVEATKSDVAAGTKRKRSMLSEEDMLVFTGMTDAVNNVVDA
jgi:hypothetical protein